MRDVRLNRDVRVRKKKKRPEELKVDGMMEEAEVAGGKVAEDLLVNGVVSSMLKFSMKKLRTPIVKMLTRSVTKA